MSKRLQIAVEQYLTDEMFLIDSSDEKKKTMVEVTKNAVNVYFEKIKYHYSDYDWISSHARSVY